MSRALLIVWSLAAIWLVGCEDYGKCLDPPAGYADEPGRILALYRSAYINRDPYAIDELLSDDFRYRVVAADADSLGHDREWTRDEHLAWSERMLTGLGGTRVDSLPQCPLDQTFFVSFAPEDGSDWENVATGPFAGTQMREYVVTGTINVGAAGVDFIRGINRIYVRHEEIPGDCLAYKIAYWDDLGPYSVPLKKHGSFSWGRIVARWRPEAPPPKEPCP